MVDARSSLLAEPKAEPDGGLDDEGIGVPAGFRVFDAHVHLFPERVFAAIWRWFDTHAWRVRYRLQAEEVVDFMTRHGVERFTGLAYAHKPDMAQSLNRFMAELARAHPQIVPLGTVFPGEPNAAAVLHEAFSTLGLRGLKLHCHVQKVAANDPRLDLAYRACADAGVPVLIHAGREPSYAAYGVDTRALCAAAQIDDVLIRHPKLTLIVPHLGADEFADYAALLDRHEHLWLDTTMAIAQFLPAREPVAPLFPARADRLLYGSDFPNIPYAWDRELKVLASAGLTPVQLRGVLYENAARLFGG